MKVWKDKEGVLRFKAIAKRAGQPDRLGFVYTREALKGAMEAFATADRPAFGSIYGAECNDRLTSAGRPTGEPVTGEDPFDLGFQPERAFEVCEMRLDEHSNLVVSGKVLETPAGDKLAELLKTHIRDRLTVGVRGYGQVFTVEGQQVVKSFTVTRVTVLPESQSTCPTGASSSEVWAKLERNVVDTLEKAVQDYKKALERPGWGVLLLTSILIVILTVGLVLLTMAVVSRLP